MTEYKPYSGSEPYIFVSYSHEDSKLVLPIIEQMQQDGYRVWYDEGIDPGTEWDENIAIHVDRCFYFVAFLSDNYLQSENCKDELNYARDQNKKRLLIYLENIELPRGMAMRLNRLQAIHKYTYTAASEFYTKLYQSNEIVVCRGDVPAAQPIEPIAPPPTAPSDIPRDISLFIENDFVIEGNALKKYKGSDAVVCVPEGVKEIRATAFENCSRLSSVQLPDSLTTIGARAFFCCDQLTSVQLPNSLARIGAGAFLWCIQLSSVHLPDSLSYIDVYAFCGCKQLSTIAIPKSVVRIGVGAFEKCTSLKTVLLSRHTEVDKIAFDGCHPDLQFIYTD